MARGVVARSLLFCFFLSLHTVCILGTLIGFSYDASEESPNSCLPTETLSFLQKSKVSPFQLKVFIANPVTLLDSLSNTGVSVNLHVKLSEAKELLVSQASAISWLKNQLIDVLPHIKISGITISSGEQELPLLLTTLNMIRSALETFNLDRSVKISTIFSMSILEASHKIREGIMKFIKDSNSFIVVEIHVDEELSLGDGFVRSIIQKATTICSLIPYNIPIVLNLQSPVVPRGAAVARFSERVKSIGRHPQINKRIHQVFTDVSSLKEYSKDIATWEEVIFPSSHRALISRVTNSVSPTKTTIHDMIIPVTNPVTTSPITVPSTSPAPAIVTVPSTNPVTIVPTNPAATPMTIPPIIPINPPITVPATNPMPTPVTSAPVMPTNPVTTPTTFPLGPPVTNPVTTYPSLPPPGGIPSVTPVTNPGTVPISPAVTGQSWCVAKNGVMDAVLQLALDYACGIGGADCSMIQPTGSCYNPDTLQAHASYAFNSYYQRNPVPTSCDFGGAAMLVNVNPSSATCMYPSSSSGASFNPASGTGFNPGSTTSFGSGSSMPNTDNTGGSNTVFGPNNPTGVTSESFLLSAGWRRLVFVIAAYCITGHIWQIG